MENTATKEPWFSSKTAKSWLVTLITILLVVGIIYLLIHLTCDAGSEHIKLTAKQVERVSALVFMDSTGTDPGIKVPMRTDTPRQTTVRTDTPRQTPAGPLIDTPRRPVSRHPQLPEKKVDLILNFLTIELGTMDTVRKKDIKEYLKQVDKREAVAFLTNSRFKIKSYFFLTGCALYFEVICWAIFGVLGSLLYYVSDAYRKRDSGVTFDPDEVPYHIAKLFYAPLVTLVLVLGYGFLSGQNLADIDAGKGMIVFAFVSGFYSGRMMNFLDRLKELLLPGSEPAATRTATATAAAAAAAAAKAASASVATLEVNIALDPTHFTDAQKADIIEKGFNKAVVKLKSADGKEIVLEKPENDQDKTFTGKNVPYGDYSLQAVIAVVTEDGSIINLEGKQDVKIAQPAVNVEIKLAKTGSQG